MRDTCYSIEISLFIEPYVPISATKHRLYEEKKNTSLAEEKNERKQRAPDIPADVPGCEIEVFEG